MRILLLACGLALCTSAAAQQIALPRIEQMPNVPQPYAMRDWRQVALGYDALLFDLERTGTYLPLVWLNTQTVNYPGDVSFGVHSYVGTRHPEGTEAINALPALVGATLAGVDKRDHHGRDWVRMAREYFNRSERVYLNGPRATSGHDWWYDTMPNVFFYQLYDLYPETEGFDEQFRSVADRWLEAVRAMGGSAAPWSVPEMSYRGWHLSTMTPNTNGVPEPEAAGAIAWLLYHAYVETGEPAYRTGAEWAMEFLDGRQANPSYELQLPFGVYTAARMNAELGTRYDVEKMLNWCFDVGPLRSWGAVLGSWGGLDVHGLIGEVNGYNDYAFAMNTFAQVGALVPLVRYDDRFARAIGKWVLNAANAARLFYPNHLPDDHQDGEAWSRTYDPHGYVAHEALRQTRFGRSPFATGDALDGGWANTNFGLYGSSHVGMMGSLIDTTDVPYILRLDARRTDFFNDRAYPTYLYFNPYAEAQTVTVDAGDAPRDLYDAVHDRFLAHGVSGTTSITLPPDDAVVLVLVPAGTPVQDDGRQRHAGGVLIDAHTGAAAGNHPPRVKGLAATPAPVLRGSRATVYCTADDADADSLRYTWTAPRGHLDGTGSRVAWTAPAEEGTYTIACTAEDPSGAAATAELQVAVVSSAPVIDGVRAAPPKVDLGGTTRLTCAGHDPATDQLTYTWQARAGRIEGDGGAVEWIAPPAEGDYAVTCRVANDAGATAVDSVRVAVRDFGAGSGLLLAHFPFDGEVRDVSPYARPATVHGTRPAEDPHGRPDRALHFDGDDDAVRVPNAPELNFGGGITISFWLKVRSYLGRESYVLSHGSWEQRWKTSLVDEHLRWTIRTDRGVFDLDSATRLAPGRYYHVTVRYDGRDVDLYLDGALDAFGAFSGTLQPATHDLTIGQRLPGDDAYNLAGDVDDLRLYDGALSIDDVQALYAVATTAETPDPPAPPRADRLHPAFPNPFSDATEVVYELAAARPVALRIYDLLGRPVRTLDDASRMPGVYRVRWDGTDEQGRPVPAGLYLVELTAGSFRNHRTVVRLR